MTKKAIEAVYPLSPLQQGMLFQCLLDPEAPFYREQVSRPVYLDLRPGLLEQAWRQVIARHGILRSAFLHEQMEQPVQVVLREVAFDLTVVDHSGLTPEEQKRAEADYLAARRNQAYAFKAAPLMRVSLLAQGDEHYTFVWNFHHLLMDGWSSAIVWKEVLITYVHLLSGTTPDLPPVRPFRDYIALLARRDEAEAAAYWRTTLAAFDGPTTPVVDLGRPGAPTGRFASHQIDASVLDEVAGTARRLRTTLNSVVQALWALVLHRASGRDRVVYGTVVSGRPEDLPGADDMVGLFINTLPMAPVVRGEDSLATLSAMCRQQIVALQKYSYCPLVRVREWSGYQGGLPLFESLLVFENYPADAMPALPPKNGKPRGFLPQTYETQTHYPLTLMVLPGAEGYLRLFYDTSRFAHGDVVRLLAQFCDAARATAADPTRPLGLLDLRGDEARRLWAQLHAPAPVRSAEGVHRLVAAHAQAMPDAPAAVFGDTVVTYAELDGSARRLAAHLRRCGVGLDDRVGVACGPGPEQLTAVLGVLHAGAAYLPLDPSHPPARLAWLVADADVAWVVAHDSQAFAAGAATVIPVGTACAEEAHYSCPVPAQAGAYVMYTSGTTGTPKGALLTHGGLETYVVAQAHEAQIDASARMLQAAGINFDAFCLEVFGALTAGACLVVADAATRLDGDALAYLVEAGRVSHVFLTPSRLERLPDRPYPHLRVVLCGGEAVSAHLVARFAPGRLFLNAYGPCETTIAVSLAPCRAGAPAVYLGGPLAGYRLAVRDCDGMVAAEGTPGEITIGGAGPGRGYLGRPGLTAAHFLPDPEAVEPGARVYRSGDRVRPVVADGMLRFAFLGRADFQIKLRGQRIELGEIDHALESMEVVAGAVTLYLTDGPGPRLEAFVQPRPGAVLAPDDLRRTLRESLPEALVPGRIHVLSDLPLNANGKVDRAQLARLSAETIGSALPGAAPADAVEEKIAAIWGKLFHTAPPAVDADFFALGGHSLLVGRLVFHLEEAFKLRLPLREVFEASTVQRLAARVRAASGMPEPERDGPVAVADRGDRMPLSFAQKRLWLLQQMVTDAQGAAAYNMPFALHLRGPFSAAALEAAVDALRARHEVLRTALIEEDGVPYQVVAPHRPRPLPVIDLSDRSERGPALAAAAASRAFVLASGDLCRIRLLRLAADEHALLVTMHHAVSDGWSIGVMARELSACYRAAVYQQDVQATPLPLQYGDYALWQQASTGREAYRRQNAYWLSQLADAPTLSTLTPDMPRPAHQTHDGARHAFQLPGPVRAALHGLCRETDTTPFMVMEGLFALLLMRYNGQDDVLVGTPTANRPYRDLAPMIGMFANTLVLRHRLQPAQTLRAYLALVRGTALDAFAAQDVPFEALVEALQPERALNHGPLFQVMFSWLQDDDDAGLDLPGTAAGPYAVDASVTAKFDLSLDLRDSGEALLGHVTYNSRLYAPDTLPRVVENLGRLVVAAAAAPDTLCADVSFLGEEERARLLSGQAADRLPDTDLGSVFAQAAHAYPEQEALVYRAGEDVARTTYRDLSRAADSLAASWQARGVAPGTRVALCLEDPRLVTVALVAAAKLGVTQIPIDPVYPPERRAYMLQDAAVTHVVTEPGIMDEVADGLTLLPLREMPAAMEAPLTLPEVPPALPLYVIYTSGSTGRPKGVMLSHAAFVPMVRAYIGLYAVNRDSRMLQTLSYAFDYGFMERWSTLAGGATLVCMPQQERIDPASFGAVMRTERINTLHCTPSFLQEMALNGVDLQGLNILHFGGEALKASLVRAVQPLLRPTCWVFNGYGPTEAAVCSTAGRYRADAPLPAGETLPIGRATADHLLYVVDARGRLAPLGAPGELWVGRRLALGYLGRPALTARAFVPDPFSSEPGGRLYRTGDLVRYVGCAQAHPALVYLGRIDRQVKLRGFRLELGEIEAVLSSHPDVAQAAVTAGDDGAGMRLIAYVVLRSGASQPDLPAFLNGKIPPYMIPSAHVVLDAFPLTANGKLDTAALPKPEAGEEAFVAPRNETEQKIAEIWGTLLGMARVGAHQHFFAGGGHSLSAVRALFLIKQAFSVDLPLHTLFRYPTPAGLAEVIDAGRDTAPEAIPARAPGLNRVAPSFAQARMWFLARMQEKGEADTSYTIPFALWLRGPVQASALASAFSRIVARHEALRTHFEDVEGLPVQVIRPAEPLSLVVVDVAGDGDAAKRLAAAEARRGFDLATGPLLRVTLVRVHDEAHLLLCSLHHIVSDGWSTGILARELSRFYRQACLGSESEGLAPLRIQYADYALWQTARFADGGFAGQTDYWRTQMAGAPAVIDLPLDFPRPPKKTQNGGIVPLQWPVVLTTALRGLSVRLNATLFMVLVAAFSDLLRRYTRSDDLVLGTPVSGRDRAETADLIGLFVNTVVLRLRPDADQTFAAHVAAVRETVLAAFAHQDVPFEQLVEILQPTRDTSTSPLFQVMFAWEGVDESRRLDMGGLQVEPLFGTVAPAAKFDLTLNLQDRGDHIGGSLVYNRDLFREDGMRRFAAYLQHLVTAVCADADAPLGRVSVLTEAQRRAMVTAWNPPPAAPCTRTLNEAFDRQVVARPDKEALVVREEGRRRSFSFADLDRAADALAARLAAGGVGLGTRLGLCLADPVLILPALLAAARMGAVQVLMDPIYPEARKRMITGDAQVTHVLTETGEAPAFEGQGMTVWCLDMLDTAPAAFARPAIPPCLPLYIIYTSGSTGRPKGVVLPHEAFTPMLDAYMETFSMTVHTRAIQTLSYAFDYGFMERWCTLGGGGSLVCLPPYELADPHAFGRVLAEERINTMQCTPSFVREMAAAEVDLSGLEVVHMGGEALQTELVAALRGRLHPRATQFNGYGPTEAAVSSSVHTLAADAPLPHAEAVPIGPSVGGHALYVTDVSGDLVPYGAPGELSIGRLLAHGYLNRPGLTAEKFVPDPFGDVPGERLYRSGDLVRHVPHGDGPPVVEYRGRIDRQVKLRGFRIELGEIEAVLSAHPDIVRVAVIVREDVPGDQRLTAYVRPREGAELPNLKAFLHGKLPEYMIPVAAVACSRFPMNANGKLDVAALPRPGAAVVETSEKLEPTAAAVAEIWTELLQRPVKTADANFFTYGGHSLLAVRMLFLLQKRFGRAVSLSALFQDPTVGGLAAAVNAAASWSETEAADGGEARLPLSFAQQRLWFVQRMETTETGLAAYNMPHVTAMEGAPAVACLDAALTAIAARHAVLRTRFAEAEGMPFQEVAQAADSVLTVVDLSGLPEAADAVIRRFSRTPFDLRRGPLWRVALVRTAPDAHVLCTTLHHAVGDGWSTEVLTRELHTLYRAALAGPVSVDSPLPPLPLQYADYARRSRASAAIAEVARQTTYWRKALADAPTLSTLPPDRARAGEPAFRGAVVPVAWDAGTTADLTAFAEAHGLTPMMVVDAAFVLTLWRYSGATDLLIGTPVAGRNQADLEGLIGCFVNTLVLRHRIDPKASAQAFLTETKAVTTAAFAHQDVPFEQLVEILRPERDANHHPLFQVMFAWSGIGTSETVHLPGVRLRVLPEDAQVSAKFDLSLTVGIMDGRLQGALVYDRDLYRAAPLEAFVACFTALAAGMAADPETPLYRLPLLSESSRRAMIDAWQPLPSAEGATTLDRIFARSLASFADREALVRLNAGQRDVRTFAQLNRAADGLAAAMTARGIRPGAVLGICLRDAEHVLVALLAAARMGVVQLLMDPNHPRERKHYLIEDAAPAGVLTEAALTADFAQVAGRDFDLATVETLFAADAGAFTPPRIIPEQPLYVIYTSGSTGRPKGVVLAHAPFCEMLTDYVTTFHLSQDTRALTTLAYAFDYGFMERWSTLAAGGTLVALPPGEMADPHIFEEVLLGERINTLQSTPAFMGEMVAAELDMGTVRVLVMGGEALHADLVARLRTRLHPEAVIFNGYGPTEAAVSSSSFAMTAHQPLPEGEAVPIGTPISSHALFVADAWGGLLPMGAPGELLIARLLAQGYLNRPALTAERFIPDAWSGDAGARLYRSGDLVRRLPHGEKGSVLVYAGRIDRQVKVRGYRIELGEIEAALGHHPDVVRVAVLVRKVAGDARLCGFVGLRAGAAMPDLNAFLRDKLPAYMVPTEFRAVAEFPMTANGKLDEAALLRTGVAAGADQGGDTQRARAVAALWAELLQRDTVDVTEDFFALGGHSLLAVRMLFQVQKRLGLDVSLRQLFQQPTPLGLVAAAAASGVISSRGPVRPVGPLPLSFAQQRLWFLHRMETSDHGRSAYNIPFAVALEGRISVADTARAFRAIFARHEVLRTTFGLNEGVPVQIIHPPGKTRVQVIDIRHMPEAVGLLAAQDAARPFDLVKGPLMRVTLLRVTETAHVLLCNMHHIIGDAWSTGILTRELNALYRAALTHAGPLDKLLRPLPLQYADFALRQRAEQGELRRQAAWWRSRLDGCPTMLDLPVDRPRPATMGYRGAVVPLEWDAALTDGLRRLAAARGATVFMVLDALYSLLLWRYSRAEDVLIGTPVAGRDDADLEELIGFFVNTLVLRHQPDPRASFGAYLAETRQHTLDAFAHQALPFEQLVEELQPARDLNHHPIFQVMFSWQEGGEGSALTLPGLRTEAVGRDGEVGAKFDLMLALSARGDRIGGAFVYDRDLFRADTVTRFAAVLTELARAACTDSDLPLAAMPLVDTATRAAMIHAWNPEAQPAATETLNDRFAARVATLPDKEALVVYGDADRKTYTFAALDAAASAAADRLQRQGVGLGTPVAMCLSDPYLTVVALLAAARLGAVQVLMDPVYPEARKRFIAADAGARHVLTEQAEAATFADHEGTVHCMDTLELDAPVAPVPRPAIPGGLPVYIIYTSGSTGNPKGVVLPHEAFTPMLDAYMAVFRMTPRTRALQTLSYAFDYGFMERWCTLCGGGTLVCLPPEELADPGRFARCLREERINTVQCTPSFIREMAAAEVDLSVLEFVHMGGEALQTGLVAALRPKVHPEALLFNGYGPTEAAVSSAVHTVAPGEPLPENEAVPIGPPVGSHALFVADAYGRLLPMGAPGELLIGRLLAHGYLNRPALTAEKFVPDAFSGDHGARLYRSGDLVRHVPHGDGPPVLEYRGRLDRQVKLRGYRIELGEIEAALKRIAGVAKAAVIVRHDTADPRLTAYVGLQDGTEIDGLAARLHDMLPGYMVPVDYMALSHFPMTPNGKLDTAALPVPANAKTKSRPPEGPLEEGLAAVWCDLLHRDAVGVDDSFFDLGGHSLSAVRMIFRVQQELGLELSLKTLFGAPTIRRLAAHLDRAGTDASEAVRPDMRGEGPPALSSAQARLWFLDRMDADAEARRAYVIPTAAHLEGLLDVAAMATAWHRLSARHESLRTVFGVAEGKPYQVIRSVEEVAPLIVVDMSRVPEAASLPAARMAGYAFDLEKGPLIKGCLLRRGVDDHVFLTCMHHIISDGWSVEVLRRDLGTLYQEVLTAVPEDQTALPPLPVQYADYAAWQLRRMDTSASPAYWRDTLAGLEGVPPLPADRTRPAVLTYRGAEVVFSLDAAVRRGVEALARATDSTTFMVLEALFALTLARFSRRDDVAVGTVVAGRDRNELENLIGFFVNTLVLRHMPLRDTPFRRFLAETRRTVLDAFAHQDLPFEQLVELLQPERSLSYSPIFQVSFAYRPGDPRLDVRMPGLLVRDFHGAHTPMAKFEMMMGLSDGPSDYQGRLVYNPDVFYEETMRQFVAAFATLSAEAVAAPETTVCRLALLDEASRRAQLAMWQPPRVSRGGAVLWDYFERACTADKDAVCLVVPDETETTEVTYGTLAARAAGLAEHLARHGVGLGSRVVVCLDEPLAVLVGLIATTRLGAVTVPAAADYPDERKAFMAADTGADHVLTERALPAFPASFTGARVYVEDAPSAAPHPAPVRPGDDHPVYIIYTSGSTGRPKGVVLPHHALSVMIDAYLQVFALSPRTRIFQTLSYAFDFGFIERWCTVACGGSMVCVTRDRLVDPTVFGTALADHAVNTLHATPSFLRAMLDAGVAMDGLNLVHIGGEALKASLVRVLRDRVAPGCRIYNGYGPTEATVTSTLHQVEPDGLETDTFPIGGTVAGHVLYVLDTLGEPVPRGVAGELYVGRLLAHGYLGRPALTAARFVPDAFSGEPGARLYRTGDLVRHVGRGDGPLPLLFLGRIDRQVKLRGYRIELGEIEAALGAHPAVAEAAVLVREDRPGDARLTAYVTLNPGQDPETFAPMAFLEGRLPSYMLPSACLVVPRFPRTPNGKLDTRALPVPVADAASGRAPETEVQRMLAGVWCEILGLESVSLEDHFFKLGGHSLSAVRVVFQIQKTLGVDLPLQTLFAAPSLEALARAVEAVRGGGAGTLVRRPAGTPAPLSAAQRRLWILSRLSGGEDAATAYNMPLAMTLDGPLDVAAFTSALVDLQARHEVLRMHIEERYGVPYQVPAPCTAPMVIEVAPADAPALVAAHRDLHFDLARGPLFHTCVLRLGAARHIWLCNMHHIVSDGWSMTLLMRELATLYRARQAGMPPEDVLPALPVQYGDYAYAQQAWFSGEGLQRLSAYWRNRLNGATQVLDLPLDRPRPSVQTYAGAAVAFALEPETLVRLKALCRDRGMTPFMVLEALAALLWARICRQDDVLLGTPVANRNRTETEGLIGFFVNTLVLRHRYRPDEPVTRYLDAVQAEVTADFAHQELPFERLVELMSPSRSLAISPLFQVLFTLVTGEAADEEQLLPGVHAHVEGGGLPVAKFDLSMVLSLRDGSLSGQWIYNTDLFDGATVAGFAAQYGCLVAAACAAPETAVGDLPLLPEAMRRQVLAAVSDAPSAGAARPADWFLEHASRTPEAVALVHEGTWGTREVTYAALAAKARGLAAGLARVGVCSGSVVGLCLNDQEAVLTSMVAMALTGAVPVLMDPLFPETRRAFMLADSGAVCLLTERGQEAPSGYAGPIHKVEDMVLSGAAPVDVRIHGEQPVYVVYTSGSTGTPKGVLLSQQVFADVLASVRAYFAMDGRHRLLNTLTYAFDFGFIERWCVLASGAVLVCAADGRAADPEVFARLLQAQRINTLFCTPSFIREMIAARVDMSGLRLMHVGGEALTADLVTHLFAAAAPDCVIHNGYGPTEAGVVSTQQVLRRGAVPALGDAVAIGHAVAGHRLYVLDPRGYPVAPGCVGELYVGRRLAGGYLNRPALTASVFIPDAFGDTPGTRLYRTGDLVRFLGREAAVPTLVFLGRVDRQVKLRGYRIELGEIEAALHGHPDVAEAVVVPRDTGTGESRLVAYVRTLPGAVPRDIETSEAVGRLPDYMRPQAIVVVASFPRTVNGKLDVAALPEPDAAPAKRMPHTLTELRLAEIWTDLLGVARVDCDSGFFTLGGHSLLAVRLIARIKDAFGIRLPLQRLFTHGTVAELAAHIDARGATAASAGVVALRRGGSGMPVFLIHPVGGHVFCYQHLAAHLGADHPCYALPADGLEGECPPRDDVTAMAEVYAARIRAICPKGPVYVGGWSLGGVVAHETARVLLRDGCRVAGLCLIDSRLAASGDADHERLRLSGFAMDMGLPGLTAKSGEGREAFLRRLAAYAREEGVRTEELDPIQLRRLFAVYDACRTALRAYQPRSCDVPHLLLTADGYAEEAVAAWRALGPLTVAPVAGTHYSLLQPATAGACATLIAAHLRAQETEASCTAR